MNTYTNLSDHACDSLQAPLGSPSDTDADPLRVSISVAFTHRRLSHSRYRYEAEHLDLGRPIGRRWTTMLECDVD
jgi:hypothetical protein